MSRRLHGLMLCSVCFLSACNSEITPTSSQTSGADQPAAQATPALQPKDDSGILGKVTADIVDAKKALEENPSLVILETSNLGSDPLTQSTNAVIYVPSRILMLNMQNTLKQYRALNDKWPNYEEFMGIVKQNNIQFNMLKHWQMYGYDSDKGEMMILQDEAVKKERFEKAGLDYVEGKP
ncbi:MAG: hypothetical protein P8M30_05535 [Planctomycetaceae bacterium]|jgi:hypothetical protein|nr:hypothetical protein [Planctomycetaceae bacterium]